jgi:hypothetical protein
MSLLVSYVVVTDTFATIRGVVRAVRASSIAGSVELIIVCPPAPAFGLEDAETDGIGAVRVIEVREIIPLSPARTEGIRAASCPLVFIGETHSFPQPGCLEALVAALENAEFAAATPVIENANPQKAFSWAGLMLTYRHWLAPATKGEIDMVSSYNACYRRDHLVALGDRLTAMMDYGSGLDRHLLKNSGRLFFEPTARLRHLNMAAFPAWMAERFLSGRFWGTTRSRHWSPARRLAYVLGAPLIPVLMAGRALQSPQWAHHRQQMPRGTLVALLLCALATAAGEVTAYIAGNGKTPIRLAEYELHRARYL